MQNDPMFWQLSLPVRVTPEGKRVVAKDTARNRNARFGRLDAGKGSARISGGAGIVHGPWRPNVNATTYAARRIATCTERNYVAGNDATLVTADEHAARKLARKPAWAR